jgi:hypothetical protein
MQDFFRNVSRYPRFFITMLLGVFWMWIEPVKPLIKRPITAIALMGILVGGFSFVGLTVRAMLGLPTA